MKATTQQKYQRQAEPFLAPGERVEAAVDGSTSFVASWVLGMFSYLGIGRAVLVTDKNVYLCKRKAAGLDSVIARYPRDSVELELRGPHVLIGDEHTIYVGPGWKQSAREVVQAAKGGPHG